MQGASPLLLESSVISVAEVSTEHRGYPIRSAECAEASDSEARKKNIKTKNKKKDIAKQKEKHTPGRRYVNFRFPQFLKKNRPQLGHFFGAFRNFWFEARFLGFSNLRLKVPGF